MATTIGQQNPLRYRGYYYDSETGFYYLQSRYYDTVTQRFVNGDSLLNNEYILGYNQFTYCNNNPVMYSDPSGMSVVGFLAKSLIAFSNIIKRIINIIKSYISPTKTSNEGIQFIADYETYYASPYYDAYGNATIGYGHKILKGENYTYLSKSDAFELLKKRYC